MYSYKLMDFFLTTFVYKYKIQICILYIYLYASLANSKYHPDVIT